MEMIASLREENANLKEGRQCRVVSFTICSTPGSAPPGPGLLHEQNLLALISDAELIAWSRRTGGERFDDNVELTRFIHRNSDFGWQM
jgi:hypothetical protein